MRKEQGLRVFENRVLRKILEARRMKVTGKWRRLRNEEQCDACFAPSIIPVIKQELEGGHVAFIKERKGAYRDLVWKREAKGHTWKT
jgi:hypothetical protein